MTSQENVTIREIEDEDCVCIDQEECLVCTDADDDILGCPCPRCNEYE